MKDIHPFLVLSPQTFNDKTSLVIGLPMTTAEYNSDNPFAVLVGNATGNKKEKNSYVLCHQPKSFDWRKRSFYWHSSKSPSKIS
jgi:mRNA interferase MazF